MTDIASLISTMYQAEYHASTDYWWMIAEERDRANSWLFRWRRRSGARTAAALEAERRNLLFKAAIAAYLINNLLSRPDRAGFYAALRGREG